MDGMPCFSLLGMIDLADSRYQKIQFHFMKGIS